MQEDFTVYGSFNHPGQEDDDGAVLQAENVLRNRHAGFRGITLRPARLQMNDGNWAASPGLPEDDQDSN
jgi:hypothetical protein